MIQRYEAGFCHECGGPYELPNGSYVKFEDHEKAMSERPITLVDKSVIDMLKMDAPTLDKAPDSTREFEVLSVDELKLERTRYAELADKCSTRIGELLAEYHLKAQDGGKR